MVSQDNDRNTIFHLLAAIPSPPTMSPHAHLHPTSFQPKPQTRSLSEQIALTLNMTQLYHSLFPGMIDWSNGGGKTALHVAAQAGNAAFINLLCDLGADTDALDVEGNTPLHYASAWGYIETVQVLLERGCRFATKNRAGFTASDYAYSHGVKTALEATARGVVEENRSRRKAEALGGSSRLRSGSATVETSRLDHSQPVVMPSMIRRGSEPYVRNIPPPLTIPPRGEQRDVSPRQPNPPPLAASPGPMQRSVQGRSPSLPTTNNTSKGPPMLGAPLLRDA